MEFRITVHSGHQAPEDALERLWARLGAEREEVHFTRRVDAIWAEWERDAPSSMTSDDRAEIGRRVVLELLRDTCEETAELKLDWFAVNPRL